MPHLQAGPVRGWLSLHRAGPQSRRAPRNRRARPGFGVVGRQSRGRWPCRLAVSLL